MGRRHKLPQVPHNGLEEEKTLNDEEIDVSPFMKKDT